MFWRRSINMLQNYAQKNVSAIGLKRLVSEFAMYHLPILLLYGFIEIPIDGFS